MSLSLNSMASIIFFAAFDCASLAGWLLVNSDKEGTQFEPKAIELRKLIPKAKLEAVSEMPSKTPVTFFVSRTSRGFSALLRPNTIKAFFKAIFMFIHNDISRSGPTGVRSEIVAFTNAQPSHRPQVFFSLSVSNPYSESNILPQYLIIFN